ncbi:MAG: flagellar hook-associated protein FlgK [Phycisphaerales bacterium]
MSINSGFSIGRTGLSASQVGLQVSGNNISNANSVGYTRQRLDLSPLQDQAQLGLRLGTGVATQAVRRLTDRALQQRAWNATSSQAASDTAYEQLRSLETLLNPLGDTDTSTPELDGPNLSSQFTNYFNAWSSLSSHPTDAASRSSVVTAGRNLASTLRDTRSAVVSQQTSIDTDLNNSIARANTLLTEIAHVNSQIVTSGGQASSGLLDRRDQLVSELSSLVNITVNEQPSGSADVLVGSMPLVLGVNASPMTLRARTDPSTGETVTEIVAGSQNETLGISGGRIGALLTARRQGYQAIINKIDAMAAQVIYQTNRAYSTGASGTAQTSFTGSRASTSPSLALNDPTNSTFANLGYQPTSGQIVVEVMTNGSRQRTTINIDLDGITNAGTAGYADDTSPASLATALSGIPNLTATIDAAGRLQIDAAPGSSVRFVDDTSGVLATLGVNSYFTGTNAVDIDVNASLVTDPLTLNTSNISGTNTQDNGVAMAMAALRDTANSALGGATFGGYWDAATQTVSADANNAKTQSQATGAVKESLDNQLVALTGVNLDEEAINLVQYQSMYQASARFISLLQDVSQTLLQMV